MSQMPHEFAIAGVYMPPLLIATLLGSIAALITANLLNRYKFSRYIVFPQIVLMALIVIYTVFFSIFVIRG